jgi:hypothetical protein
MENEIDESKILLDSLSELNIGGVKELLKKKKACDFIRKTGKWSIEKEKKYANN